MISYSIFVFFLVQSTFANLEDSYSEPSDNYNLYSEDILDPDEGDIEKRDNHFMRFGRNSGDYKNREMVYDEYEDINVPNKRSGNHHVRFGRSGPSTFLRFGRDQSREGKNKSVFLRLGRNFQDHDEKIRSKRSAPKNPPEPDYPKRKDHFMRFGKSSSFMRYGRDPDQATRVLEQYLLNNQLSAVNGRSYGNDQVNPMTVLLAKLLARRHDRPCEVSP